MKAKVKISHHREAWVRGDLEAETILIDIKEFKTKKEAIIFIKSKCTGKNDYTNKYGGYHYTGYSWIHENTGEKHNEYYSYDLN